MGKKTDQARKENITPLTTLIERLRGEKGCPWDRKQTPWSMSAYLVEEVYELAEAIIASDIEDVKEELGDVLFQVLFIMSLYQQQFGVQDVVEGIMAKMIRRHPHVFGEASIDSVEGVKENWERIKKKEKVTTASILDTVPSGLPGLQRAAKISSQAANAGFDWDNIDDVLEKVDEELRELKDAVTEFKKDGSKRENVALEMGDLLFTLVNVARFADIHPETALMAATNKFEKRFRHMEKALAHKGKQLPETSMAELNRFWERAKSESKTL